jgi:uncharacterized membrane protein YbaN (DUF454 family)
VQGRVLIPNEMDIILHKKIRHQMWIDYRPGTLYLLPHFKQMKACPTSIKKYACEFLIWQITILIHTKRNATTTGQMVTPPSGYALSIPKRKK